MEGWKNVETDVLALVRGGALDACAGRVLPVAVDACTRDAPHAHVDRLVLASAYTL